MTFRADFKTLEKVRNAQSKLNLNFSEFARRALRKFAEETLELRHKDTTQNMEELFLKFIYLRDKGFPLTEVFKKLHRRGLSYDLLMEFDARYNNIIKNDLASATPFVIKAAKDGLPLVHALRIEALLGRMATDKLEELGYDMESIKAESLRIISEELNARAA